MKALSRLGLAVCLASVLLLTLLARSAYAATINVGCDVAELIAAINTANSTPEADTLELAADCVYALTAVDNTDEARGPTGLPLITTDITLHGNNATIERSTAQDTPSFRLLYVTNTGILTFDHLALKNGLPGYYIVGQFPYGYSAGALRSDGGKLTIQSSKFIGNQVATGDFGGAGGAIWADGEVIIKDTIFELNRASLGGAIAHGADTLTIQNSVFRRNDGTSGGALATYGTTLVSSTLFVKNYADAGEGPFSGVGGAITNGGEMTLQDSTMRRNTSQRGGGIQNDGKLTILRSTFTKNGAVYGGAVRNFDDLIIVNSTFFKNHAQSYGGAIMNYEKLKLRNTTLASNRADVSGGNLYAAHVKPDAVVIVSNSILSNGAPENCVGSLTDQGGNLRFPKTDKSCVGKYGDPKLGPLAKNGGATRTMALLAGSAAIHLGDAELCKARLVNNRDQRGVKRVRAGQITCDSGAYEVE